MKLASILCLQRAWIDKYVKGRKMIIMIAAIALILDTCTFLYQAVYFDTSERKTFKAIITE